MAKSPLDGGCAPSKMSDISPLLRELPFWDKTSIFGVCLGIVGLLVESQLDSSRVSKNGNRNSKRVSRAFIVLGVVIPASAQFKGSEISQLAISILRSDAGDPSC